MRCKQSFDVLFLAVLFILNLIHMDWTTTCYTVIVIVCCLATFVACHGPLTDRDNEDIAMGKKGHRGQMGQKGVAKMGSVPGMPMGAKWCSMAKVCNHDRVPICGVSHAGDVMGFRDLCDMFDFNCIRKRNYKQTNCPADKSFLTVSRKPTNAFYDD